MASTAVSYPAAPAVTNNPVASSTNSSIAPSKSYIQRCWEDITNSDQEAKKLDRYATWRKVAAWASAVLFIAAAAATTVLTGLYAPVYVPVTMVACISLMKFPLVWFKNNMDASNAYKIDAERKRAIAQHHQELATQGDQALNNKILAIAPQSQPESLQQLRATYAHYDYWVNRFNHHETETQNQIQEAQKATDRNTRLSHYVVAQEKRQQALVSKVTAALFNAVIRNPSFAGGVHDVISRIRNFDLPLDCQDMSVNVSLRDNPWVQSALMHEFNDASADQFVLFANKNIVPLTKSDVHTLTIQQIADRILAAMTAPI
ncbi:MAG TPA: hypothetical protein VGJ00_06475 [Rhabdochlamydiaceae bacterium]